MTRSVRGRWLAAQLRDGGGSGARARVRGASLRIFLFCLAALIVHAAVIFVGSSLFWSAIDSSVDKVAPQIQALALAFGVLALAIIFVPLGAFVHASRPAMFTALAWPFGGAFLPLAPNIFAWAFLLLLWLVAGLVLVINLRRRQRQSP